MLENEKNKIQDDLNVLQEYCTKKYVELKTSTKNFAKEKSEFEEKLKT